MHAKPKSSALETVRPPRQRGLAGTIVNSAWPLVAGIAIALVLHFTVPNAFGAYYTKITIDCGIAIILAVSLNIVNGMTGQFSLGHAAFMALGGYTAGVDYVLRLDVAVGNARRSTAAFWDRANGCLSPPVSSAGSWPRWPGMSSACRRCVCGAITWRS